MEIQNFQPSFGMAVKYEVPKRDIKYYIATQVSSIDKSIEADNLIEALEKHKAESELLLAFRNNGEFKLGVFVGDKFFTENFFVGPITVLKRAIKAANKLVK